MNSQNHSLVVHFISSAKSNVRSSTIICYVFTYSWDCDFHEIHKRWWIRKTIKQNRQLYKKWTGGFKNQPEFNYKFESNTIIHCVSSIRYNCIYAHFLLWITDDCLKFQCNVKTKSTWNTLQIHRKTVSQTIKLKSTMFLQAQGLLYQFYHIFFFYKCYILCRPKKHVMKYLSDFTLHGAGRITANHINGIANVFNDPSARNPKIV